MLVVKWLSYLRERIRFASHNTESIKNLLKKDNLSEKEFQQLFYRMNNLECIQMQLLLMKKNPEVVDKIIKDMEQKCANIPIPDDFDSKNLLNEIYTYIN